MSATYTDKYDQFKVLGKGGFGIVYEVKDKASQKSFAAKVINHKTTDLQVLQAEVAIMKLIKHKNCMGMIECFNMPLSETTHKLSEDAVIILELISGGELFDRIVEQGAYTEKDAAKAMYQVMEAINYLHSNKIVHRDIKPENLLLVDSSPAAEVKISDFGLSTVYDESQHHEIQHVGSYGYMAPEILALKSHGPAADIFSLGVVLYIMLCGYPPYDQAMCHKYEPLIFPEEEWSQVSDAAKDLVRSMLEEDPVKRPTAATLLQNSWLKGLGENRDLSIAKEQLKKFNARRKFKSGILTIKANNAFSKMALNAKNHQKKTELVEKEKPNLEVEKPI